MADFLIKRGDLRTSKWVEAAPSPLADGTARLKVEAFALTANNVTYATFGEAIGYWNFFPASDAAWGRVPVWGFATVAESKADGVPVGARVYGYLPISHTFDVTPVRAGAQSFMDGAANRQGLAPIYNTYIFTAADPGYDAKLEAEQMLFRPLFTTGFMIDDCLMESGADVPETVVISSASSKTALALAHCLKSRGGVDAVGLTSPGNKAYVEGLGLYARVETYDSADSLHARGLTAYVDFLGRPSLTADVHNALRDRLARSLVIGVTDWEGNRAPIALPDPQPEFFFVPTYAAERAKALGADVLNARLGAATRSFLKASGAFVTPEVAKGQAAIEDAWLNTLDAKVSPSKGLVLSF
jgi:NADPH:quinone reductase-like Zn-dependent oxidoreductase